MILKLDKEGSQLTINTKSKICSVDECQNLIKSKGMCEKHYYQHRRTGKTTTKKQDQELFFKKLIENPINECVIWPFSVKQEGYGSFTLDGKAITAHRAALIKLTGKDPENMVAAHGPCHNRLCVNPHPEHGMRWATQKENNLDRHRDKTMPIGDSHHMSKISKIQVCEIRKRASMGEKPISISKDYPISVSYVRSIINGSDRVQS